MVSIHTEQLSVFVAEQKPDIDYSTMYSNAPRMAIGGAAQRKETM
jgi:hypothetical protein